MLNPKDVKIVAAKFSTLAGILARSKDGRQVSDIELLRLVWRLVTTIEYRCDKNATSPADEKEFKVAA
jgi:hypothetical protein